MDGQIFAILRLVADAVKCSDEVFSKRLKEEREKRGWTQEYMANLLQIKIGTLSGYERNYRTPDLDMVMKITNLLGVSVDYLLGREETTILPGGRRVTRLPHSNWTCLSVISRTFGYLATR